MFKIKSIIRHSIKQTDSVISICKRNFGKLEDLAPIRLLKNLQNQNQDIKLQILAVRREHQNIIKEIQNFEDEQKIFAHKINLTRFQRLAYEVRENIMAKIFTDRQSPFQFINQIAKCASEPLDCTMTNIEKDRWHTFVSQLNKHNVNSSQLDDDTELIIFICKRCVDSNLKNVWKHLLDEINPDSTN